MPVNPTYPGVYIEEIPSGQHPITGVATSIAAFVDFFPQGPTDHAVHIFSWADFERQFGGLDTKSEASYAVQQFFLNGGTEAYIVRATSATSANAAVLASITLQDGSGNNILLVTAATPGQWGNNIRLDVDYGTTDPIHLFNLTITEVDLSSGTARVVATELYRNLSLNSTQPNYAINVVNNASRLATLKLLSASARPAQTGTASRGFSGLGPAWTAQTVYTIGTVIVDSNGNLEKVTGGGTSGNAAPAWPTDTSTAPILDSGVSWKIQPTGSSFLPTWSPSTAYNTGDEIIDSNGNLQVATAAGTSKTTKPVWATVIGTATPDGAGATAFTWQLTGNQCLAVGTGIEFTVSLNGAAPFSQPVNFQAVTIPPTISWSWLAATLQQLVRKVDPSLASAAVNVIGSASKLAYLQFKAGTSDPNDYLTLTDVGGTSVPFATANVLKLAPNVQQYSVGSGLPVQAQVSPTAGSDGKWDPNGDFSGVATGLVGDAVQKTGMYMLLNVDLFNILCIPAAALLPDTSAAQVAADATALCTQRRAMYLLDAPQQGGDRDTLDGISNWLDQNDTLRSRNAVLYFPRTDLADPLNNYQLRPTGPCGTIAGIYSRTDVTRGVWKAPAGTEATLAGVQGLEYTMTDAENGALNPVAINCLRNFPVYGIVCWGARTLNGADQLEDDYKYVPVRRLALYLEESLYRGTKWVVFEPNDEPLWAQIRASITGFMQDLFRQGAFQGSTPQQAYLVKCDSETTTPLDQQNGIVNIVVGFAPLKPAEFVIIQIQQLAGQTSS
jgi:uncharacterized protein